MESNRTIVIKIGGKGAEDRTVIKKLSILVHSMMAENIRVVLVHGGGHALTAMAQKFGVGASFIAGRRVTDDRLIELAKMAFIGKVATDMASWLHSEGFRVIPLSGISGGIVEVTRRLPQKVGDEIVDYGWVGDISRCQVDIINLQIDNGYLPLISSLGVDKAGHVYNINADTFACRLARELGAYEVLMLMDQKGLFKDLGDSSSLIGQITLDELESLVENGAITGGMLPKIGAVADFLRGQTSDVSKQKTALDRKVRLMSWFDTARWNLRGGVFEGTTMTV